MSIYTTDDHGVPPSVATQFIQAQAGCVESLNQLMTCHDGLIQAVVCQQDGFEPHIVSQRRRVAKHRQGCAVQPRPQRLDHEVVLPGGQRVGAGPDDLDLGARRRRARRAERRR